jgi:hypothetical protein
MRAGALPRRLGGLSILPKEGRMGSYKMQAEQVEKLAEELALEEWGTPLELLPERTAEDYKKRAYTLIEQETK